jgi:hypothetical protein
VIREGPRNIVALDDFSIAIPTRGPPRARYRIEKAAVRRAAASLVFAFWPFVAD